MPCSADTSSPPAPHCCSTQAHLTLPVQGFKIPVWPSGRWVFPGWDLHFLPKYQHTWVSPTILSLLCFSRINIWGAKLLISFKISFLNFYFFLENKTQKPRSYKVLPWASANLQHCKWGQNLLPSLRGGERCVTLLTTQQRLFWIIYYSRTNKSSGCKAATLFQIQKWKTRVKTDGLVLSFKIA